MTPCIEFQGPRTGKGYGWRRSKAVVAAHHGERLRHRQAWVAAHGPIPDGLCVLHHCDNPPCYRLDHLFLGTKAENWDDMRAKGRNRGRRSGSTHCPQGHEYTLANTIAATSTQGRKCRECSRIYARKHWALRSRDVLDSPA